MEIKTVGIKSAVVFYIGIVPDGMEQKFISDSKKNNRYALSTWAQSEDKLAFDFTTNASTENSWKPSITNYS